MRPAGMNACKCGNEDVDVSIEFGYSAYCGSCGAEVARKYGKDFIGYTRDEAIAEWNKLNPFIVKEVNTEYFVSASYLYEIYKNTGLQNKVRQIFNKFAESFEARAKEAALSGKTFLLGEIRLNDWVLYNNSLAIVFVHSNLKPYFESKLAVHGYKFMLMYHDEKNIIEYTVSWDIEAKNDD